MRIKEVEIENFRGIRSIKIPLDKLTVLIGENNCGKTTILDSLRIALTRGYMVKRGNPFSDYDYRLSSPELSPEDADPISITIHFAESQPDEWPEEIIQKLTGIIQLDESGLNHIWLRLGSKYNAETRTFDARTFVLNSNGEEMVRLNTEINTLLRLSPIFSLSSLRDASQEFTKRGQFWKSFLQSFRLPPEEQGMIEEQLLQVNNLVIEKSEGLSGVVSSIANARRHVPLSDDPVQIEAVPTRIFDILGNLQVHLKSQDGVKIPIYRYGEGTQSIATLLLFQAFATENLTREHQPESTPILTLEEPEAHLHPSGIRSVGALLENMLGQTLVASHSGDLVSRVPITSLRRLYKCGNETKVGLISKGTFSEREIEEINYHVRMAKGHYMFSRVWLLVEGKSELFILPGLFDLLEIPWETTSLVEISQVSQKGVPLARFAEALGIKWSAMLDNDTQGQGIASKFRKEFSADDTNNQIVVLENKNIEQEFWFNGFDDFFQKLAPKAHVESVLSTQNDPKIQAKEIIGSAGGKTEIALALAEEIRERGVESIPSKILAVVNHISQMSGG